MILPSFFASSLRKPVGFLGMITGWFMDKKNFFVYPEIEKYSKLSDGLSLLEIGFGTGTGLRYYLNKYDLSLDGIDFSNLMCKKSEKRNKKFIVKKDLRIYCSDFLTYNKFDRKYDRIIFSNVIYFWNDINRAFSKIKSLLNDKGILVFFMSSSDFLKQFKLTNNKHFNHYHIEDVIKILDLNDFKNIRDFNIVKDNDNFKIIYAENEY